MSDWAGYAVRWARLHGGADPRALPAVPRGWLRMSFRTGLVMAGVGLTPAAVTVGGLLLCLLVPVVAAGPRGWPLVAAFLVVLSALADTLDGAVAVLTGRASSLGYVLDSVCDRIGEAAWLLALWLVGVPAWLVVGCGGLVWLHEYIRARATAAGMSDVGTITVAERPTRVIMTAAALVWVGVVRLAGAHPAGTGLAGTGAGVLVALWALLGVIGLVQLLRAVTATLAHRPPPEATPRVKPAGGAPPG